MRIRDAESDDLPNTDTPLVALGSLCDDRLLSVITLVKKCHRPRWPLSPTVAQYD